MIRRRVILLVLLLSPMLANCSSPELEKYENPESGIRLEKPSNWEISYTERNATTYLRAEQGIWNKDATSILIFGAPCPWNNEDIRDTTTEIERHIDRIQLFFDPGSITVIQDPYIYQVGEYEFTRASIEISASAFEDTSDSNEINNQESHETRDLYLVFNDEGAAVYIEVRKGKSIDLNTQADAIVESIQFFCPYDLE